MKEQSIALVSCPSLFLKRSTCTIFPCFASSEAGMENGKPATTALINLFSWLSSVRFSSLVVLRVCIVLLSLEVRIHSPLRLGRDVNFKFGNLVLKAEIFYNRRWMRQHLL